jgi:PPE-repeat protein
MDFALLPPEINSARMYTGPGSGPMLAAAAAWDGLAAELRFTASSYQSVIAGLTAGPWLGSSSVSMAAAAAPYVAWMTTTAAQAEQTADQAQGAAAAYETAFAETVPPPVIAANRTLLMALVATNIFGQNTPAIATTEGQYAEMWAQDAAAMYGYAGASASATTIAPFSSPAQTTSPGGTAGQAAGVAQAIGTSAGNVQSAVSSVPQAVSAVPNALSSLANPAAILGLSPLDLLGLVANVNGILDPYLGAFGIGVDASLGTTTLPYDIGGALTGFHTDDIVSGWQGVAAWPEEGEVPPTEFPAVITSLGGSSVPGLGASTVSAGLGQANTIGGLSVPSGWAAATPLIRPLAVALPATSVGAAAEASAGNAGSMFSQMALASMAGRALVGSGRGERSEPSKRKPIAPARSSPSAPITSIAAELRELASLRDSGILTDDEFSDQKRRLLAF